jgi:serine/threonine protein kinase
MADEGQPEEKTAGAPAPPASADARAITEAGPAEAKVKDRYRIERELGRGGFGIVYLARDELLHSRPVVVKVLRERSPGQSEWFSKKFREEREALARLDHPGIVGVLDSGEMPDGKPFLVMQFVDGVTLRSVLRNGPLPLERTAQIVRRIAQALNAAHDRGVYHRDLKPENIMLQDLGDGEELVKIIDFGIATVKESQAGATTGQTGTAGSGPYMAPEQLLGRPSAASDIYALGVIAYELVTGDLPFHAGTLVELYQAQEEGIKVKPVELRPDLPLAAQEAILKALAFGANDRYAHARDFGEQFARALTGSSALHPSEPAETAGVETRKKKRAVVAGVIALTVVFVAAILLGVILRSKPAPPAQPERSFSYSIAVQKARNGQPVGAPFTLPGEMIFQADFQIRLLISSPQPGYLYILNEGPVPNAGLPSFNLLFPGQGQSASIAAHQVIQIPRQDWIVFDEQEGTEKMWLVWARGSVPELEAAKAFAQAQDQGAIHDPSRIQTIRTFLDKYQALPPLVEKDEVNKRTYVRGRGDILVKLTKLEHH